ncbi:M48 family metalloprotease, partial [Angustibacter aerolatus]
MRQAPRSDQGRAARWAPVAVLGVLLVLLMVLAAVLVPWSVLGAGAPTVRPLPLSDFTAGQLARDTAFHADLRVWTYPRTLLQLAVVVWLGLSGAGARVVGALGRRLPGGWPVQVVAGVLVLSLAPVVVGLPCSVAAERVLRRYGLSTQHWGGWVVDVVRSWAVTAVVTALLLLLGVALARRWRTWWWAPAAVLAAVLAVAGSALYPVLVEPLANHFRPLAAGPQRTQLLQLADRAGVPIRDVLVADASRRTTAENAYVSGLGGTRRLVVYDTLLRGASPREVDLVVAHEHGHVGHHDVRTGTALDAVAAAGTPALLA